MNLGILELKAFVPAKDLAQSLDFYRALGFEVPWEGDGLAEVRQGTCTFLLQQFYVREHAENFMMHLLVKDVDAWYRHVLASGVVERFGARVAPPEDRPWGLRDFPLTDPAGVLWRIAQSL